MPTIAASSRLTGDRARRRAERRPGVDSPREQARPGRPTSPVQQADHELLVNQVAACSAPLELIARQCPNHDGDGLVAGVAADAGHDRHQRGEGASCWIVPSKRADDARGDEGGDQVPGTATASGCGRSAQRRGEQVLLPTQAGALEGPASASWRMKSIAASTVSRPMTCCDRRRPAPTPGCSARRPAPLLRASSSGRSTTSSVFDDRPTPAGADRSAATPAAARCPSARCARRRQTGDRSAAAARRAAAGGRARRRPSESSRMKTTSGLITAAPVSLPWARD